MSHEFKEFPSVRYGPGGATITVDHEEQVPDGFVDHPSKLKDKKDRTAHGVGVPFGGQVPGAVHQTAPERDAGTVAADHTLGGNEDINRGTPETSEQQGGGTTGGEMGQTTDDTNIFTLPPIDDEKVTKPWIISQLNTRKIVHNPKWKKEKLYQLLHDAVTPGA